MKFKFAVQKFLALSLVVCMGIHMSIPVLALDGLTTEPKTTERAQENMGVAGIPAEPETTEIPAEPETTEIPTEPETTEIPTEPGTTETSPPTEEVKTESGDSQEETPGPDNTAEPETKENDTDQTDAEPSTEEASEADEIPSDNSVGAIPAESPDSEEAIFSAAEEVVPTQAQASGKTILDIDKDDNVKVRVIGIFNVTFSGAGTSANPYYYSDSYLSSDRDTITIETANPQASINGGANSLVINLSYGENQPAFTVTSADGTKTAYYKMLLVRNKSTRASDVLYARDFSILPATVAGNDGKIMGLNPDEYYDYRKMGDSVWIPVNGVSEITGLAVGTYQLRYGESPEYKAALNNFLEIQVIQGGAPLEITMYPSAPEILVAASASPGDRVDFKVKMKNADQMLKSITWQSVDGHIYTNLTIYPLGYETIEGERYFAGYFIMPQYPVRLYDPEFLSQKHYTISYETIPNIAVKFTPARSVVIYNTPYFEEGTPVTINVAQGVPASQRWVIVKSYVVCNEQGAVVAESADGSDVTVAMTGNFTVQNIVYETLLADLTAAEEQLKRLDGVDLYDYTDDTRIPVQEILELAPQLYTLPRTAYMQAYLDGIVADFKLRIDNLVPKPGDVTKANQVLNEVPQDMGIYTEETVKATLDAKEALAKAVKEKWDRTRQTETDALISTLEQALAGLKKKPADYSAVDAAKEKIPDDLSIYTEESVKRLQDVLDAVALDLDITQQDAVVQAAADIEAAIQALEVKTELTDPPKPADKPGSNKKENPVPGNPDVKTTPAVKTADTSMPGVWAALLAASGIVMISLSLLVRKKPIRK